MIIVGDLHIKEHHLYRKATMSFLKWLLEHYKDEIIIQLGDLFDSSSINHNIVDETLFILKQFKDFRIISGNHDQSKRMSNILKSLNHFDNIIIYEKDTEVTIEDKKCLMLPHQHSHKYYEDLEGSYNFIFPHVMPKEESFGGEFTDLSKLQGMKIYGHIHTKAIYNNGQMIIPGVPVITRNGECNNPILKINLDSSIEEIEVPVFFNIVDIEYGTEIVNKDWLYNIKNAPSVKSVYDMYPEINIRSSGISINYLNEDKESVVLNSTDNDLKALFSDFAKEKEIEDHILKEGITALNESIGE